MENRQEQRPAAGATFRGRSHFWTPAVASPALAEGTRKEVAFLWLLGHTPQGFAQTLIFPTPQSNQSQNFCSRSTLSNEKRLPGGESGTFCNWALCHLPQAAPLSGVLLLSQKERGLQILAPPESTIPRLTLTSLQPTPPPLSDPGSEEPTCTTRTQWSTGRPGSLQPPLGCPPGDTFLEVGLLGHTSAHDEGSRWALLHYLPGSLHCGSLYLAAFTSAPLFQLRGQNPEL